MPRPLHIALRMGLLGLVLAAGAVPLGPFPALGPLLDPAAGVWAVARHATLPRSAALGVAGLGDSVMVRIDDRGVPHIWAGSEEDAYRALGYIVARDRLFQMELQTRATAGRLTEWVGPAALPSDRLMRSLRLAASAERDYAALDPASSEAVMLRAYADGVNAWIATMSRSALPLEYRLLGVRPEPWRPEHSLYLAKRMSWTLSYSRHELQRSRVAALVGEEAADALMPRNSAIQEPVQPNGRGPTVAFAAVPPPGAPIRSAPAAERALLDPPADGWNDAPLGSNNWAAGPSRTRDGYALLAGDPHLDLTLPSIWYEVHIVVPGALDAYGVTIPGGPGILIGFNRDLAWSFTNSSADVADFFRETVDDSLAPTRTRLGDGWRPVERRIETYRGKRGGTVATDTLYASHRGPLLRLPEGWISLRWTALDSGSVMGAIQDGAKAASADAWLAAMERFVVPPQSGLVADRRGTIALRAAGHYPLRPDDEGGRLRDGASAASDWLGFRPLPRQPFAKNPAQGYLASANQQPIDPAYDRGYLGRDWPAPWRALRINALLRLDSAATPESFRAHQTDPGSPRAEAFLPAFVSAARGSADTAARRAAELLAEWDARYTRHNERAILFELAMRRLPDAIWDELADSAGRRPYTPGALVVAALLRDPESLWWDDRRTPSRETRDTILAQSLGRAYAEALESLGPPDGGGWRWDRAAGMDIHHLLRLPALSALDVPNQGGPGTLSPMALDGTHGASWRMVVRLGPIVEAWTVYPGGQSGNPASPWYRNRIPLWSAGSLEPALVPAMPDDLPPSRVVATLRLGG